MPVKGYRTVTIAEEVYNLAREICERERRKLRLMRIRSVSQLVEAAVVEFAERHFPRILREYVGEEQ